MENLVPQDERKQSVADTRVSGVLQLLVDVFSVSWNIAQRGNRKEMTKRFYEADTESVT